MPAGVAIGRLAGAGEIAPVGRFLLSGQASYLTGQVIPVAGGP